MNENNQDIAAKNVKKNRKKGIAIVGLCIVACKLPFLLAFLGFGGLGATASLLDISPTLQRLGVTVGLVGITAVSAYFIYSSFRGSKS